MTSLRSDRAPRTIVLGDGLLGSHLARELAAGGHDIQQLARGDLDLRDAIPAGVFVDADVVINAMATTNVDACEENPREAERVNAQAAGEVAARATAAGARLLHISTDYALHPVNVYARTKLAGEEAVSRAHPDALIVRVSTTFGPHPRKRDFVRWVIASLSDGGILDVAADLWSSPTYAVDAARFIAAALGQPGQRTLHFANHPGLSRYELALAVQRAFAIPGTIRPVPAARVTGLRAPRARDTRMPWEERDWFKPMSLDRCLADYARRLEALLQRGRMDQS